MNDILKISIETDWFDIIQLIVTIAAFVVGGIWTYLMFIQKRQKYPRSTLEQKIQHKPLPNNKTLLFVDIELSNIGEVLITPESLFSQIEKIFPLNQQDGHFYTLDHLPEEIELPWQYAKGGERMIKKYQAREIEIEPGESQTFHFEFIITEPIATIKAYSYISNYFKRKPSLGEEIRSVCEEQKLPEEKEIGWSISTRYDLNGGKNGDKTNTTESATTT